MDQTTLPDIDTMEAGREFDAAMAMDVMGWRLVLNRKHWDPEIYGYPNEWHDRDGRLMAMELNGLGHGPPPFCPSTDIAADYEVLQVACKWLHKRREVFCDALRDIWGSRTGAGVGFPSQVAILYQPGDYSRAALKTVRATKHQEEKP